jgi:hypothetical protein
MMPALPSSTMFLKVACRGFTDAFGQLANYELVVASSRGDTTHEIADGGEDGWRR